MGYENLNRFVDYIRMIQVKDDNNVNIGITGALGSGKSSASIQIARRYVERYFGEKYFDVDKYVAFNNDEIIEKIHSLPKFSPLIGDEAIRFAWSRDWNKAENKELARLSAQIRTKKLIFFMNIPKISWIDSAYREQMLDIWIWIHSTFNRESGKKEGYAILFEPDLNQAQTDSWHMDTLKTKAKRRDRVGRFTHIDKILKYAKSNPCFQDSFIFPKVPEEIYKRYLKIRDSKVFEKKGIYINQKDTSKIMVYNLRQKWDDFLKKVQSRKHKCPSYQIIADVLLNNPMTGEPLLTIQTLHMWDNTIISKVEERTKNLARSIPLLQAPELIPEDKTEEKDKPKEEKKEIEVVEPIQTVEVIQAEPLFEQNRPQNNS